MQMMGLNDVIIPRNNSYHYHLDNITVSHLLIEIGLYLLPPIDRPVEVQGGLL